VEQAVCHQPAVGHSNFLVEQEEVKYLGKELVRTVFNFERMYNKFRIVYPDCAFNHVIDERITVLREIAEQIAKKPPELERLKYVTEAVLKVIWQIDLKLKKFVEEQIKKEEDKNEQLF